MALGAGVLSLGLSAIFVRWAQAPGVVSSFYRMAIATVAVGAPFAIRMYKGYWPPWSALRLALLGGIFFAADLAAWATGVVLSGATNPTLMANTAPVWVGLGAMVLFRQRLSPAFWVGIVIAIVGAALVLGLEQEGQVIGSLLGLLAAVFYAGYFLVTQLGREKLDSLSYFWFAAMSSAAVLLLLSWGLDQPLSGYPPTTYLTFVAMALTTQIIGYFAISFALGYLPASVVAPTLLGQPVITAILAGALLGETLGSSQILGGLGVLAGVLVVVRSQQDSRN
ncbi:MAG: DMT family transporter [Chloroflexi bacterium]|nr:DMT family transporter [Chloroflexota bacterium]